MKRALPALALFVLIGVAYWLFSLHPSTPREWRDQVLVATLALMFLGSAVYLLLRTREVRPQLLGIVALMLGDAILYGIIFANTRGWTEVTVERRGDMLRACLTVGGVLYVGGIVAFEWVQWRKRRRGEPAPPPETTGTDTVVYAGPERRTGPKDRRGWRG